MLLSLLILSGGLLGLSNALPTVDLAVAVKQQSKQLIDPAFYHTLRRYTLFSAAGLVVDLTGACPTPPDGSALLQIISNTTTSTAVSIFRADTTKEIIASFPGTDSLQDFLTDFTFFPVDYACAGCQVHSGFYNAYQSIAPALTSALTGYVAQYPGYTVTITGHSLGGALAGLAYPDLKFTTALPVHKAYTFGQPRVGNAAFASFVDALSQSTQNTTGNYIRTTHFYDGVPQLPGQQMGFRHSRTEFFELDANYMSNSQDAAHTYRCFGQEAADCSDLYGTLGINNAHIYYSGVMMTGSMGCSGETF